jgi:hypothetical protein
MDACRSYASAGSNATRPVLFESMVFSILLAQQKQIIGLEKALDALNNPKLVRGWLLDVYPSDFGAPVGKTFFSYGHTFYRAGTVRLHGRIHIDENNTFIIREAGFDGFIEIARTRRQMRIQVKQARYRC